MTGLKIYSRGRKLRAKCQDLSAGWSPLAHLVITYLSFITPNFYVSKRKKNIPRLILDLLNSKQKNLKANLGSQRQENGIERQPSREGLGNSTRSILFII